MACVVMKGAVSAQTFTGLEQIGIRDINSRGVVHVLSIDEEIAIGKSVAREFETSIQVSADSTVQRLIERVGRTLAANSDVRIAITTKVIVSDDRNAFALPGGWIYVTTGLIRAASAESELAAALSQGIAHVAARHAVERLGSTAFRGAGSRNTETSEADFLGIQYLFKAGYDPIAAIRMLQTLEIQGGFGRSITAPSASDSYMPTAHAQTSAILFQTHPPISRRVESLERAISMLPSRSEHVITSDEFDRARTTLSR
jgi:predicted Zn-dependent protease